MKCNVLDNVPVGIIISDIMRSKIIQINKVAKKILKIDDNSHSVESFRELLEYDIVYDKLQKHILAELIEYGESENTVFLKTFDNTFVEVNLKCFWKDKDNGLVGYIFENSDEEKESSVIEDNNHEKFKELAEFLPSGIVIMNTENELSITYANTEHYKILGIHLDEESEADSKEYLLKDLIFEEDLAWVMAEISLSFAKHEDVDIEFRIKTNTAIKWIRLFGRTRISSNGKKLFYSSLKDLSNRRSLNDKTHMEKILFQKITQLTDETLFRLDIKNKIIHFLGNKSHFFGELTVFENYPESVQGMYKIHEDDMYIHEEMMECFENGIEKPMEMRYMFGDENYEWHRTTFSFIKNSDGENIIVIGKIANIHTQKLLEEQAKTDLLTGFYNKVTTEHETNRLINFKKNQSHAFFIIDIDNFKAINDNLGHHFGDMVLIGIVEDIRECFRNNDMFGRIGGDEFVVLMRGVTDIKSVYKKAEKLCKVLNKNFASNDNIYNISASIGISMYPKDGNSYEELYKKSDVALYDIKKTTKNGYKRFDGKLKEKDFSFETKEIDNKRITTAQMNTAALSTVLNILYETKDLSTSVNSILQYLGGLFKVDKCYLFETFDKGNTYDKRYKWYKNKVYDEVEKIDNVNINNIFKDCKVDGVLYTNDIYNIKDDVIVDILVKENVQSIFLMESLVFTDKNIVLGLEDCHKNRVWSQEDVATLMHIGRLIFTAINSDRKYEATTV